MFSKLPHGVDAGGTFNGDEFLVEHFWLGNTVRYI